MKYRVYECPDGCASAYCGEYETLDEAIDVADSEPNGTPECEWASARAARHGRFGAPPDEGEEGEPLSWHGVDGFFCVVPVSERLVH